MRGIHTHAVQRLERAAVKFSQNRCNLRQGYFWIFLRLFMKKSNSRQNIQRNKGFTLIEIMVVVVILGILATLVVPKIMGRPDEARVVAEVPFPEPARLRQQTVQPFQPVALHPARGLGHPAGEEIKGGTDADERGAVARALRVESVAGRAALEVEALALVDRRLVAGRDCLSRGRGRGDGIDTADAEQRHEEQYRGHDRIAPPGRQSLHACSFRPVSSPERL